MKTLTNDLGQTKEFNDVFMVYGKRLDEKRYKPFDMNGNKFVVNLIHASMFFDADKDKLIKEVEYMNKNNAAYTFEVRRGK